MVYLDHAATTPLDPRVLEKMLPFLKESYGNASSVHTLGRKARFAVEESREKIAYHLGAQPAEIIFTSGATEANNLALKGLCVGPGPLVTSSVEHEAILTPAEKLAQQGREVVYLKPAASGCVEVSQLEGVLAEKKPALVSIMHTNNETGSISEVCAIGERCAEAGTLYHCDAVQAGGHTALDVNDLHVAALSLSGHKMYGPKGVGVLFVRGGAALSTLIEGGAQERKRRGGTENVAAIVGMAEAFELSILERESRVQHLTELKHKLLQGLKDELGQAFMCNTPAESAPHIVNIAFKSEHTPLDGEMLLLNLDAADFYLSAGSACTSGAIEPSHVLLAMGLDRSTASAALRISIGKDTTEKEIDRFIETLGVIVRRMKKPRRA